MREWRANMPTELKWFMVRLALIGVSEQRRSEVVRDLQHELSMRPHLRNPQAYWEAETHRLIVYLEAEELEPERLAKQMMEELFEISYGVLQEIEGIHIEILDVNQLFV
jgi:hypothetical protein